MDQSFKKQLENSWYIHRPLALDESRSIEAENLKKHISSQTCLWDVKTLNDWVFDGEGTARVENGSLIMQTGSRADKWPEEEVRSVDAKNGAYATFGSYIARLNISALHPQGNRISFKIKPICDGLHSPIVRVGFVNNGSIRIPDAYSREGFNAINLKNGQWNTCTWEIESIAHDKLEEISFNIHRYGKELSSGDILHFELKDIYLQQIDDLNVVHGWQCKRDTAVFSTTGYWPKGKKTAIACTDSSTFDIIDDKTGNVVYSGPVKTVENNHGRFQVLDFTALETEGVYHISFNKYVSMPFAIASDIADSTVWKLINFLFSERCGFPVPGKHGTCHGDQVARWNGILKVYQGGWHDAADVSQQSTQSAEVVHALLETAEAVQDRDPLLYGRLMEEAGWGLDFVLRAAMGDGFRMTHAGIRRWTDGLIGNMDDCDVVVHNSSFDNFLVSGAEAYAAWMFKDQDAELAYKCTEAAEQDYGFAVKRFEVIGVEIPMMHEHTANASTSQYLAAAVWSAAQLYKVTGKAQYYNDTVMYANRLLACQDRGEAGCGFDGFFYRDETKRSIVHFNHQSREHIFVQALAAACCALPDAKEKPVWEEAMSRYGNYLKALRQYTAPYGMLPAGVYHESEIDDERTFRVMHPNVDFDREKQNYREQLENGVALGNGYYIRSFPVWFSFRGNSAVHMAMGKAASILGRYFNDGELLDVAAEQLYWTLGKNPFGESLIYGEGSRYGQQYTALLGETVGEIPVGVQTRRNEDLPYWPPANIATYREVWTTPVRCWLWIAADLMQVN